MTLSPSGASGPARSNGSRTFIDGIQALRAIAAISVVIYHSGGSIASAKYQDLTYVGNWTKGLVSGVDLFFVISGFVISLPLFSGRARRLRSYAGNRFLRIYPLVFLTAGIFALSNWAIYHRSLTLSGFESSFLLLPSAVDPVPIVLWTLKQEVLFYAIFTLALIRPTIGLPVIAAWALASVLVVHNSVLTNWLFHVQNIQFAFGVISAALFIWAPIPRRLATVSGVIAIGLFYYLSYWVADVRPAHTESALILGLSALSIVYCVAAARPRVPKLLMSLGTASYSIYLIHFFFVSAGNKALTKALPYLSGLEALIILSVFATICGALYYFFAERPLEAWRMSLVRRRREAKASAASG